MLDARLFLSISNSRAIIDFRNLLAHDYGDVDDDSVFGLAYSDLIATRDQT
ncbi:MAG: HepT-like ribonuclease domain-containing protein [Cyanobium sp.]